MRFGVLFMPQDPPDGRNIVQRWAEILDAAVVAEEAGFDGVFVPEHHMMPDGYLPSPLVACAALAARTKRVEIGTTIFLLPFYHPIQVAEAAAMVDIISNGRMRLGCGLGNFDPEFELFGLEKKTQVSRFEEAIDLVQRAWAGEDIDHQGKHFNVKGRISPLPVSPELWLGAMSEPGVRRAARFGAPWATDPLHNIHVIRDWADIYSAAGEEYGTSGRLKIHLQRDAWVADDLDEVERDWWPHVRRDHFFYFQQVPRWVADREPFLQDIHAEEDFDFHRHRQDRMIVGSPDDCVEQLKKFDDELDDLDYVFMRFRVASGPSHEKELECLRRFGRDVIPRLRAEAAVAE
jgi:alkanesulfonate monooxygenase SsuD/methylene tetrahydromethanopterin reductase-like flavin-dependent oxidoreductase (luciferase family)